MKPKRLKERGGGGTITKGNGGIFPHMAHLSPWELGICPPSPDFPGGVGGGQVDLLRNQGRKEERLCFWSHGMFVQLTAQTLFQVS
jgi:hypothetical protein